MKRKLAYITILSLFSLALSSSVITASDSSWEKSFDVVAGLADPRVVGELAVDFNILSFENLFPNPGGGQVYRLAFSAAEPESAVAKLKTKDGVLWAQLDHRLKTGQAANDEFFTSDSTDLTLQWYLPKVAADKAWDKVTGAPDVTIAIVDTGIFSTHQDLSDGRVVAGQAFYCQEIVNDACNLRVKAGIPAKADSDDNGHGTAVASVAGAIGGNLAGIAGVAWNVKLMPIKVLNKDGVGLSSDVAEGIVWAAQNGADVINLSLGGAPFSNSQVLTLAAELATQQGSLVVAAAGNDRAVGSDLDIAPSDPVCADGNNNYVLGVAALDSTDRLAHFSNFGKNCIDVSAPGVKILAAHFDPADPSLKNIYAYRSGTSFAAPIVSGAAALIRSLNPAYSPAQVRDRIVNSADNIDSANVSACGNVACTDKLGGGRINIWHAVSGIVAQPPLPPVNPNPSSPVADGNIVKLAGDINFYLMEQGQKRLLTNFVIQQRQLNTSAALEVNNALFNSLPTGSPLPPLDGTLIKAANHPLVSIVKNGIKRPMTFLSFTKHNFSFSSVVSLPDAYVNSLPGAQAYPPPARTVLRGQSDPTVFVVENDLLHAMNFTAFNNRGFVFRDVNYVSDEEIKLYPIGATYLQ